MTDPTGSTGAAGAAPRSTLRPFLASPSVWIAALACAAALITGCGNDDPPSKTAQATTPPPTQTEPEADDDKPKADSDHATGQTTAPDERSPSGPRAQKIWRQVNNYGHPVPRTQAAAATAAIRRYTTAAAAADGHTACGLLASQVMKTMGPLGKDPKACSGFLEALFSRLPPELQAALRQTKTLTVRARGNQGVAYIQLPGNRSGSFPLIREQGHWRIGAISANIPTQR